MKERYFHIILSIKRSEMRESLPPNQHFRVFHFTNAENSAIGRAAIARMAVFQKMLNVLKRQLNMLFCMTRISLPPEKTKVMN